jgi:hypothetical protein
MPNNKYRKVIPTKPSSFQRERGLKPPAKGFLIATEGQVTEPVYFEEIKKCLALPTIELYIAGAGIGDPATLADEALRQQKIRRKGARAGTLGYAQVVDFDEIWIVFDTDVPLRQGKLQSGLRHAESKNVQCAHSTPCFEYWLLLHLERTAAPMATYDDVKPRLSKALCKVLKKKVRYDKDSETAKDLVRPLAEKHEVAEAGSAWVRRYHRDGGTDFPWNPSTEVDRLIAAIREARPKICNRST